MNKTLKYILYGAGTFVAVLLLMCLIRSLIREVSFAEVLKDWTNWLVAVVCGGSTGYYAWKKDQESGKKKEDK